MVNASGSSLAVIGTRPERGAEWAPGYLQVFDTASHSLRGSPVPVGRMPRHILITAAGD